MIQQIGLYFIYDVFLIVYGMLKPQKYNFLFVVICINLFILTILIFFILTNHRCKFWIININIGIFFLRVLNTSMVLFMLGEYWVYFIGLFFIISCFGYLIKPHLKLIGELIVIFSQLVNLLYTFKNINTYFNQMLFLTIFTIFTLAFFCYMTTFYAYQF